MHSDAMGVVVLSKKKQRKREREREMARSAQKGSGCNGPLFVLDINVPPWTINNLHRT